ncbi:hypothetical protein F0562_031066 [Nyssa sinensis]|uniref:RNase H type-1 domain-containing protein n=1 Tax=Nyssa sinensis TaxID=561372 RepID=A0A5J5ASD6_9ASTE|nr:hypothetical protein F0562_031066 [Nyssa sinensis]
MLGKVIVDTGDKAPSIDQALGVRELVKSSNTEAPEGGDNTVSSSTLGSRLLGEVIVNDREKLDDAVKNNAGALIPSFNLNGQNGEASLVQEAPPAQSYGEENLDDGMKEGTGGAALVHSEQHNLLTEAPVNIGEPAENATLIPPQDGLKLLVPLSAGSLISEKSKSHPKLDEAMEKKNAVADGTYPSEVSQHTITGTEAEIHTEDLLKTHRGLIQSVQNALLLQDGQANIGKYSKDLAVKSNASNDTMIVVDEGPVEPAASQTAKNIIASAETETSPHIAIQVRVTDPKGTEAREFYGLEIIKSTVYGGLIESITSLGVVSSAVGAYAATLNVLALGLANLIGGLLIIGHNLWELKNDHSVGSSNQITERVNRYQEQLGRRENFLLHATVSVLAFLTFGLVPPVTYSFSFRESDNRDFKLVAVASASLLSIIILAIGKVYVQRPPKSYIKTVVYYVIMGFMASGVSYVVGNLIMKLLEKLGCVCSPSGKQDDSRGSPDGSHERAVEGHEMESDCSLAISFILSRNEDLSEYSNLIVDCGNLAADFVSCIFLHTLQEANKCADILANLGNDSGL